MPPTNVDNGIYHVETTIKRDNVINDDLIKQNISVDGKKEVKTYKWELVWRNILVFIYLHITAFYGLYLWFSGTIRWPTILFCYVNAVITGMGITAGAHRLWSHKSYKAKWPLRLILIIANSMGFQNSVYEWARDHRVHHKFTDTDADPHNITRGFFFAHMGWLLIKKHEDVKKKGSVIDMSDLEKDPIVMFQHKYYAFIMPIFTFFLPTIVLMRTLGEPFHMAWCSTITRYVITLHGTWLVNSAAHLWGYKPYDKGIKSSENLYVSLAAFGEGWHNYHHVFPWDYKTSELGKYLFNSTKLFIDFFAMIGWAYDLKTVSPDQIRKRGMRTGDGTSVFSDSLKNLDKTADRNNNTINDDHEHENMIWGWDDKELDENDKNYAIIKNKSE